MAVGTGFDVTIKLFTATVCTCTSDKLTFTAGTCTCTTIPYIDTYSCDYSLELFETTGFGDRFKHRTPGFPDYTLQFSGGLDLDDSTQLAFFGDITCSATSHVKRCVRIVDGGRTVTHRGYITGSGTGSSVGGKSTFSVTLTPDILPASKT